MPKKLNKKYSHKDFTGVSLVDVDSSELNHTMIKGTCFSQENLDPNHHGYMDVFPADMVGVVFVRCNLDNCHIPPNNIVKGGCHRRIKEQTDLEDWETDSAGKPLEPIDKAAFIKYGHSLDPNELPKTRLKRRR